MKARTLKQLNKIIQEQIGDILLIKGKGYFYVTSEDEEIGLRLAGLDSTSIYVCHLNQQTVSQWIDDVRQIASKVL